MDIKHFQVKDCNKNGLAWYGLKREGCPETILSQIRRERELAINQGVYSERDCEVDCFLSVLSGINKSSISLLDLGTGWGEWSLALHGVLNNNIISTRFKDYSTVAVECDEKFYQLACNNFLNNKVKGRVLNKAIGKYQGFTNINVGKISNQYCGSSLSFSGYFSNSRILAMLSGVYHLLSGNTKKVEMVGIDQLVNHYFDNEVNFLIMDIQGAEVLALDGIEYSLDKINYMMIGTHGNSVHEMVKEILRDDYEFIVDAKPNSITEINDEYKVICQKGQDGILLCESKNI